MRVRKTITIDDRKFEFRELTVREIIDFFENATKGASEISAGEDGTESLSFLEKEFDVLLKLSFDGEVKAKELMEMTPSSIQKLWDAFKEVNDAFFVIARQMGLDKTFKSLQEALQREFSGLLVNSSRRAMQTSGSTDTPTSLPH